jgi:hypothetical protein
MMRAKSTLTALLAGGALASAPSALGASPAKSPEPGSGKPSCNGLIVASFNHGSGADGPSGNPTASAGPGSFFGPGTHEAIETLARGPFCTP